jgi:hypothetical protein
MDMDAEDQLNRIKWMLHDGLFDDELWHKCAGPEERVEWLLGRVEASGERLAEAQTQLLEILEQLNDAQDRSERYREALVKIASGKDVDGNGLFLGEVFLIAVEALKSV